MKQSAYFRSILLASLLAAAVPAVRAKSPAAAPAPHTVIGAFLAPPMGAGPGKLAVLQLPQGKRHDVSFGQAGTPSGNSFYVAVDARTHRVFVPSIAGTTTVADYLDGKIEQQFKSIPGGRVARLSPDRQTVFVLSGKSLAAYSTRDDALRYQASVGGNALAFNKDGSRLYVGGNMSETIAEIDTASGEIERQIPIAHSGDLAWANGLLFSADMKSGVMTAFNPQTNRIVAMPTGEVDPHFAYNKIPAASAGFMQLAVSPRQDRVYAAGFSGHVLHFSTTDPTYLGQVKISAGKSGPNKLSGLAVLPDAAEAITTVENRHESVLIDLRTGKVLKHLPKVASNRWILAD
ncbi:MAG TPA: WD40 repeat domain-containing protein [Rhodocyclaceae bacterium]|nr:WD40 repeat domain-containing protein [Rhodocyclaceae bacterium]